MKLLVIGIILLIGFILYNSYFIINVGKLVVPLLFIGAITFMYTRRK